MTPHEIYGSFRNAVSSMDAREVLELNEQLHGNLLFAAEAGPEFVMAVRKGAAEAIGNDYGG